MSNDYLRYRALWPLVPAIAMVMIDFTIVSISATTIQQDLGLTDTGVQWLVTGYALSTAAFITLGGRLGDMVGHKRIVVSGIVLFALSSLMCGLVPDSGEWAEPWLIFFRILQGVGGALLVPSATVLVLEAFPKKERGAGLSTFFIVAGLFTAVGPIAGSYLTEYWTWRAIFWINVPVAILALTELYFTPLKDVVNKTKVDVFGALLLIAGMALAVLGVQQSTAWGWEDPRTIGSIAVGVALLVAFVRFELRSANPLLDVRAMAANRDFAIDNVLTFLLFFPWLGVFFFGSMYFQVAVGQAPTQAGFSILTMFYGFFIASRVGGGLLDKYGPKLPVTGGFLIGAIGMVLWATELTELGHIETTAGMLVTGAGFGLAMSSLNADALNRLPSNVRGTGSGIVQAFRNFGSALGMAIMGTIVATATTLSGAEGAKDFSEAMEKSFYVGAAALAIGFLVALTRMSGGVKPPLD